MLIMRLRRIGRKSDPHYRVVVAEHTAPVQGKFIAEVGHYHPKTKELVLNQDQVLAWLEKGAQVSNTVAKLCDKAGISHERVVVTQYQGQPKKKAVAAAKAKEDAANAPAPAAEEAPADEATETESESPAEETPEAETPTEEPATEEAAESEETPSEEPAEEAPADEAETKEEA